MANPSTKKTKLGKIVSLYRELSAILSDVKNVELRFQIYEFLNELKPRFESFEKINKDLITKHGEKQADESIRITTKFKEYSKELEPVIAKQFAVKSRVSKGLLMKESSEHPFLIFDFLK